ncbi:MAG TPA: hypothetical protein VI408_09285 [Gaiellaceae bacterium]
MPETPEQFWERTHDALRMPPVEEWETWPFAGELRPRELAPPVDAEAPRHGAGGVGCRRCERGDEGALWSNGDWIVSSLGGPTGLPFVALLETQQHLDFPELSPALAAALGPLMLRVQRALLDLPGVGNVHVCRWGDGSEHFHMWFMARPARIPQLLGSFAAIWDDILPPVPEEIWRENRELVRRQLAASM